MVANPAVVATARELLARLGISVADLREFGEVDEPRRSLAVPTVGEYLPRVIAAAGPGARRTYGSYWARMAEVWGTRPLDDVTASDIEALQRQIVNGLLVLPAGGQQFSPLTANGFSPTAAR
jgi:hypothetical protein